MKLSKTVEVIFDVDDVVEAFKNLNDLWKVVLLRRLLDCVTAEEAECLAGYIDERIGPGGKKSLAICKFIRSYRAMTHELI